MSSSALASAIEWLAQASQPSVRFHAARTLGSPRKFGPINVLREDAERDMLARDVRELFLLPYSRGMSSGRLRGEASAVCGRVLVANASVALDALIARGCLRPGKALDFVLDDMAGRAHRRGFFYEPHQVGEAAAAAGTSREWRFVHTTSVYLRFLLAFGRGRDTRIRRGFEWLVDRQEEDGTWRPPLAEMRRDETASYALTRGVAAAFAELPATSVRLFSTPRRRLAAGWSDRILERFENPDAVLTELNISEDPRGPSHRGEGPALPKRLADRILYFPLEDLWLALAIGASPKHENLAPWIGWLEETQLADGSWRLGDPSLRERLLMSDPNGRLRAEALYLTDDWITLRASQVLYLARKRARARKPISSERVAL